MKVCISRRIASMAAVAATLCTLTGCGSDAGPSSDVAPRTPAAQGSLDAEVAVRADRDLLEYGTSPTDLFGELTVRNGCVALHTGPKVFLLVLPPNAKLIHSGHQSAVRIDNDIAHLHEDVGVGVIGNADLSHVTVPARCAAMPTLAVQTVTAIR